MTAVIEGIARQHCIPETIAEMGMRFKAEYASAGSLDEARAACERALALLRAETGCIVARDDEGLQQTKRGKPATLITYLTHFRRWANEVPLSAANTLQVERYDSELGKAVWEHCHVADAVLIASVAERGKRRERANELVVTYGKYQKLLRATEAIQQAEELIADRNYWSKVAVGLMMLTGRRSAEILKSATFQVTGPNSLHFAGQLKTRGSKDARLAFEIPCLCDAFDAFDALQWLREHKPEFLEMPNTRVHQLTKTALGDAARAYFDNPNQGREFVPGATPHKLRAAYGAVCWERYRASEPAENRKSVNAYLAEILGHDNKNITTSLSYQKYTII
ncbi:MAG: hypothetical protein HC910_21780 [Spirulinaceae cyanobacterium SM2_1_0]|nr:hypothetical protein [Spirulinaceae cyanobacterium SM2_1_0]